MSITYRVPIYRLKLVKDKVLQFTDANVDQPHVAARLLARLIGASDREQLVAIFLDGYKDIVGAHVVAVGCLDSCRTTPREVFKAAIVANAHGIVLGHNHPSGGIEPSEADIRLTRKLVRVGALLGVPILDHLIVWRRQWCSFVELGLLPMSSAVELALTSDGENRPPPILSVPPGLASQFRRNDLSIDPGTHPPNAIPQKGGFDR